MSKINCTVNSCTYWGKGDICEADAIMVRNNKGSADNMEIGTMGGMSPGTSAETMCETFKPKAREDERS